MFINGGSKPPPYALNEYEILREVRSLPGQHMRPPPVADEGSICWHSGRFCAALQAALAKGPSDEGAVMGLGQKVDKKKGGI